MSKQSSQQEGDITQANPKFGEYPDVSEFSPSTKESGVKTLNSSVIMDLENKINPLIHLSAKVKTWPWRLSMKKYQKNKSFY